MSRRFLDHGQLVGYDFAEKMLIVTMKEKTAKKMRADGWDVGHDTDVGYFVNIKLTDGEYAGGDNVQKE